MLGIMNKTAPLPVLAAVFFGLAALEPLAYLLGKPFSVISAWLWAALSLAYAVVSCRVIVGTIARDLRHRTLAGSLILIFISGLILQDAGSFSFHLNGEAAHQVTVGLKNLAKIDLGYTECGFFCYPSRQYLLVSVPSALFGPGVWQLRTGYAYILLSGMLLFYAGLRRLYDETETSFPAAIGVALVFSSPLILFYARDLEQAILPVSLTLHALAWVLILPGSPSAGCTGLAWSAAMLGTAYTPALSCWALFCLLLGMSLFKRPAFWLNAPRMQLAGIFAYVLSAGVSSFLSRDDISLNTSHISPQIGELIKVALSAVRAVLTDSLRWYEQSFCGSALTWPIMIYLLWSWLCRGRILHKFITLWALGVIASAALLHGYAPGSLDKDQHRAMAILPVLICAMLLGLRNIFPDIKSASQKWFIRALFPVLLSLLLMTAGSAASAHKSFFESHDQIRFEVLREVLGRLQEPLNRDHRTAVLTLSRELDLNLADYFGYFIPGLTLFEKSADSCPAPEAFAESTRIIAFLHDGVCLPSLQTLEGFEAGKRESVTIKTREGTSRFDYLELLPRSNSHP